MPPNSLAAANPRRALDRHKRANQLPASSSRALHQSRRRITRGYRGRTMKFSNSAVIATAVMAAVLAACTQTDDPQSELNAQTLRSQSPVSSAPEVAGVDRRAIDQATQSRYLDVSKSVTTEDVTAHMRSSYFSCLDSSSGATWEIQQCISEEWEFQELRMNTAYQDLTQRLPEDEGLELHEGQRTWMADFESGKLCALESHDLSQAERIEANECALRSLTGRAVALEILLERNAK